MSYSRTYLNKFNLSEHFGSIEHKSTTEDLMSKLFQDEKLTLAEEDFVCSAISILHSDEKQYHFNTFDYEGCKNYNFRSKYLTYFRDLNCYQRNFDFKGEISQEQKESDRHFLESEYQKWHQLIDQDRQNDELLDYVSKETKHHIKLIRRKSKEALVGSIRRDYLIKSIVLHGKFIYLLVKEFLQELGAQEIIFDFYGNKILVDGYCYVHILFRHYSELIKEHQLDKTYHYNHNIDYKTMPSFLVDVIQLYQKTFESEVFNGKSIDFIFDGNTYSIWFRPFTIHRPGKVIEKYLRLQTFYPVGLNNDIARVGKLSPKETDEGITFLVDQ